MNTSSHPAEQALVAAEQQLAALSDALRSGNPSALQNASEQMRNAAQAVAQVARAGATDVPALRQRIERLARLIGQQREQMARHAAYVDRALVSVLPQTDTPTYSPNMSRGAFSPNRGGAARIYAGQS